MSDIRAKAMELDTEEAPPEFNFKIYKCMIIHDFKRRAMKQNGLEIGIPI